MTTLAAGYYWGSPGTWIFYGVVAIASLPLAAVHLLGFFGVLEWGIPVAMVSSLMVDFGALLVLSLASVVAILRRQRAARVARQKILTGRATYDVLSACMPLVFDDILSAPSSLPLPHRHSESAKGRG